MLVDSRENKERVRNVPGSYSFQLFWGQALMFPKKNHIQNVYFFDLEMISTFLLKCKALIWCNSQTKLRWLAKNNFDVHFRRIKPVHFPSKDSNTGTSGKKDRMVLISFISGLFTSICRNNWYTSSILNPPGVWTNYSRQGGGINWRIEITEKEQ